MTDYDMRFGAIKRLYGNLALDKLKSSHVCVIGIGGVGSWSVEALARSGVGKITIVDLDDICITNVNRQIHAIDGQIGRPKVEVMKSRALVINPEIQIDSIQDFFTENTAEDILSHNFDYVIDAIDSLVNKAILINECVKRNLKVVTVGGAGGKQDPTKVLVEDLCDSWNDRLLQKLRKHLRGHFDFPREKVKFGVKSIFSHELPYLYQDDGSVCQITNAQLKGHKLDCYSGYGSITPVTATLGFVAANEVIKDLISK
ncbi:ThiF family adenylyltransferase [Halobacteriovorax sp. HLS]|uniref:tRNA threonylcarbamoyladenosine dehydratase n=1 Tax=Halobacteriovorax sp. HLS TaxID=2234000 RepID=UPI000FD96BA5|nr:tRNA threonylcarbamoyladenosine dehydratase [Halobacteriovorax sp. HLS]